MGDGRRIAFTFSNGLIVDLCLAPQHPTLTTTAGPLERDPGISPKSQAGGHRAWLHPMLHKHPVGKRPPFGMSERVSVSRKPARRPGSWNVAAGSVTCPVGDPLAVNRNPPVERAACVIPNRLMTAIRP